MPIVALEVPALIPKNWWLPSILRRRSPAQILPLFALTLTILLGLVGAGVDYGFILVEDTGLQNALDASSLAGARMLVSGANPGTTQADTTARSYLTQHGYTNGANNTTVTTSFPVSANGLNETIVVTVSRIKPTYFWRVFLINTVTVQGTATAVANRGMVDIILSLDLTGSMQLSGTNDEQNLRDAVVSFVNTMNPSTADTRGPKIGISYWTGSGCSWNRGTAPNLNGGDGDTVIDLTGTDEYVTPCYDVLGQLTPLTNDPAVLLKIANNVGGGACPVTISPQKYFACPLTAEAQGGSNQYTYPTMPVKTGIATVPTGYNPGSGNTSWAGFPSYSGTKLPNAFAVVNGTTTSGIGGNATVSSPIPYAWSTAQGGRNNASGEGWARKVMLMMTDGVDELWPTTGNPNGAGAPANWDTLANTRADALKLGPDGVAGTFDDVEVYTVGFFCTPYSSGSNWCLSKVADTTSPHACPGSTVPGTATTIDLLLNNIATSSPNTCDHYFPLKKTENMSTLFTYLAGTISRGKLTN